MIGGVLSLVMVVFSGYIYSRTGDWVALVFLTGSLFYAVFFFSGKGSRDR
jgi:hypothetical protein